MNPRVNRATAPSPAISLRGTAGYVAVYLPPFSPGCSSALLECHHGSWDNITPISEGCWLLGFTAAVQPGSGDLPSSVGISIKSSTVPRLRRGTHRPRRGGTAQISQWLSARPISSHLKLETEWKRRRFTTPGKTSQPLLVRRSDCAIFIISRCGKHLGPGCGRAGSGPMRKWLCWWVLLVSSGYRQLLEQRLRGVHVTHLGKGFLIRWAQAALMGFNVGWVDTATEHAPKSFVHSKSRLF